MSTSEKYWQRLNDYEYELRSRHSLIATFKLHPNASGSKAEVTTDYYHYTIERTGFWKNTIIITDAFNKELLRSYPGKWYANTFRINVSGKTLKGEIRNNPTAELLISHADQPVISYGLDYSGSKVLCRIDEHVEVDLMLHIFSWMIYLPIVQEFTSGVYSPIHVMNDLNLSIGID